MMSVRLRRASPPVLIARAWLLMRRCVAWARLRHAAWLSVTLIGAVCPAESENRDLVSVIVLEILRWCLRCTRTRMLAVSSSWPVHRPGPASHDSLMLVTPRLLKRARRVRIAAAGPVAVVIRPIPLASVNHRLPSCPAAIARGK